MAIFNSFLLVYQRVTDFWHRVPVSMANKKKAMAASTWSDLLKNRHGDDMQRFFKVNLDNPNHQQTPVGELLVKLFGWKNQNFHPFPWENP